jgi:4-amino-4-deoxy-L-arabinose transferase-like glycosyltransferase
MEMTEPPQPRRLVLLSLLGVCALACLLRWPIAAVPLERDEGEYAYIAQRWWLGEVPYRDSFDQKPPGVFAAYAVIQKTLGTSPAAIHWGTQVYTLGTLALIYLVGRELFGATAGLVAALLAAFMTADVCVLGQSANTETFMILPLTAAFLATLRARDRASCAWALLAGVCGSLALLCKQVALPNVLLSGVLLLVSGPSRWRLLLAFVLGGVLGLAPMLVYFAVARALPQFWDCVVAHNIRYAQRMAWFEYPEFFWLSFRGVLGQWWPILALAVIGSSVAGLCEAGSSVPGLCEAGSSEVGLTEASYRRRGWLVVAWLVASALGISVGGYFRGHYYVQAIPPLAVLGGRGATLVARRQPRPQVFAIALALAAGAWGIIVAPWYYIYGTPEQKIDRIYGGCPFAESIPVAAYLRQHSVLQDTAFVFGSEPQILYYAARRSASRYIFAYPLMTPFPDTRERQREVIEELTSRPPRFLVYVHSEGSFLDDEDTPPDLREFIDGLSRKNYLPVAYVTAGDEAARPWRGPPADPRGIPAGATITIWERGSMPR